MKKCPFCGANIEESARFCLYCMQSLTEKEQILPHQKKKPQWLIIIAAIVVPILIFTGVLVGRKIALKNAAPPDTPPVTEHIHTPATAVIENLIDSSCTEAGSFEEAVYCSVCGAEINRTQKAIDKKAHDYNQKVTSEEYIKAAATCTDSAVYYYSCVCGLAGTVTFTDGVPNGHSFAADWDKDSTYHWHKATCGHTSETSEKNVHNYGEDNVCDTCGYERTVNVSAVTLNFTSLAMTVDDVRSLIASITPTNATNPSVTWESSDTSIVTIDEYGNVTAIGTGTAIITVTTEDGEKSAQCTIIVSAKVCPHTTTKTERENEIDSTCKVTGTYDEVVYCSTCGDELSRTEKTIDKKDTHTEGEAVTEKYVDSTFDENGSYDKVIYCTVCGKELDRVTLTIPAKKHTPANAVVENKTDSTCTAEGSYDEVVYCSVCHDELSRITKTIKKKPHSEVIDEIIPPTCTDTGLSEGRHCSVCNEIIVARHTLPETGHSFSNWTVLQDPTCTVKGIKIRVCFCNEKETETIPALNHSFDDWVVDEFATCIETGTKHRVCLTCHDTEFETIPIDYTAHNYDTAWTSSGVYHWHKCLNSECTSVSGKTSHAFGEWIIDSAPTCVKSGKRHHICDVCQKSVSESYSDSNAHNYSSSLTSNDTHHWYKCENSGCASVSGKTSHTFGKWIIDTAANCMKTGTRHHICTDCQKSVSETYNAPDAHKYASIWTVDSTHHWHVCTNSGCTSVSEKTAHKFTDGFCSDCGVKNVDTAVYTRDGNYIYFGEYPQSLKAADVTITDNMDVRGYYIGSDGYYYAKALGDPRYTTYKFKSGELISRYTFYYFKVEPIRWRIISENGDTALLICDSILTNIAYNDTRTSTYDRSEIRSWLNDQFYNDTFNEIQKHLIDTVLIDNDFGEAVNDKVFLLNREAITNPDYGFSSDVAASDVARRMTVNDYARATGTDMSESSGYGTWMMGEAEFGAYADSMNVLLVAVDGSADNCSIMTGDCWGVVPSLQIKLSHSESFVDASGLTYKINDDGASCTITGIGTHPETEIIIPDKINGMNVTSIGEAAFWGCNLTSITIPESVTSIGKAAFGHCYNLTSIIISANVTDIGEYAFDYCTNLDSVIIEENTKLTRINSFTFNHCGLTSINIPATITSMGEGAFRGCSHYDFTVHITDMTAWCNIKFDNQAANPLNNSSAKLCLNGQILTDIVIPDGVTAINNYAFAMNFNLKSVTIADGVTSIGERAFYCCMSLTEITIPDSVNEIGNDAFNSCLNLAIINYCGTEEQWKAMVKGTNWDNNSGSYIINYNYTEQ